MGGDGRERIWGKRKKVPEKDDEEVEEEVKG